MNSIINNLTDSMNNDLKNNNEFKNFIDKFLLNIMNTTIEESKYEIELDEKDKLFYEKLSSLVDDVNHLTDKSWINLLRYSSQEKNTLLLTLLTNLYGMIIKKNKDDDDISLTSSLNDSIDEEIENELNELKIKLD